MFTGNVGEMGSRRQATSGGLGLQLHASMADVFLSACLVGRNCCTAQRRWRLLGREITRAKEIKGFILCHHWTQMSNWYDCNHTTAVDALDEAKMV